MVTLNEHVQKAIKAFESDDPQSIDVFNTNAVLIYNHFACFPDDLDAVENPYLVGLVYFYLEGALRDTEMIDACYENACYCFAKVMMSESCYERQCAAMRLFLLMNDNGISAFELCCKVFEKYCADLNELSYEKFKIQVGCDLQDHLNYTELCVKQYAYSVFTTEQIHSYLPQEDMSRIQMYINYGNYERFLETPYPIPHTHNPKFYFEKFYEYLKEEIKNHSNQRAVQISIEDIN